VFSLCIVLDPFMSVFVVFTLWELLPAKAGSIMLRLQSDMRLKASVLRDREIILLMVKLLTLNVFLHLLIIQIPNRYCKITSRPYMLAPIPFPQTLKLHHYLSTTLSLDILH
jgi:hypothetical protein